MFGVPFRAALYESFGSGIFPASRRVWPLASKPVFPDLIPQRLYEALYLSSIHAAIYPQNPPETSEALSRTFLAFHKLCLTSKECKAVCAFGDTDEPLANLLYFPVLFLYLV